MDPSARITLRLQPSEHHTRAGESAMQALAATSKPVAGDASSAAAASSSSSFSAPSSRFTLRHRGVLIPSPPTLTALRSAAMDLARADPHWSALMQGAKLQRRHERAEARRKQRKRARTDKTTTTAARDGQERKTTEETQTTEAEEEEEPGQEDGNDSEADSQNYTDTQAYVTNRC